MMMMNEKEEESPPPIKKKYMDPRFQLTASMKEEAKVIDPFVSLTDSPGKGSGRSEDESDSSPEADEEAAHNDDSTDKKQAGILESKANVSKKILSRKKIEEYNTKLEKRGVVYLSRIPPFMKPAKVKHLLEQYGEVTRVYLVEEDASVARRRKKNGGNTGKKYVEGWVEFDDKKTAKLVAQHLNNKQIGGKKRHFYREDIWNIKYLKKFKWRHLTEKIAYEKRVREQKLRLEMMQAKKENAEYIELVEKGKKIQKMEEKRAKKNKGSGNEPSPSTAEKEERPSKIRRTFKQLKGSNELTGDTKNAKVGDSLLRSVFSSTS